jgi:hypothetical protein
MEWGIFQLNLRSLGVVGQRGAEQNKIVVIQRVCREVVGEGAGLGA